MTVCGRSNRARATASWSRSPVPATRWRVRWSCSGHRWRRSGCASACIPARCSCATRATTSARPSTGPHGCAIWPTAARPCCRAPPNDLVVDRLPADAWLTDLGTHPLRDLPRPERVVQLCHPDLRNEFPPLRHRETVVAQHLPVQFTSFVGRDAEMNDVRQILADNRLVTLTGAGGVGKTRLAVQVAAEMAGEFGDGVWYRRSGADHRSRSGAGRGGPRAGPARPAGPLHDGHAAAVYRRPSNAAGAGQLRAPAGRERGAGRRPAGRLPCGDGCWRPAVSRSGWPAR